MLEMLVGLQVLFAVFAVIYLLAWFLRKRDERLKKDVSFSYVVALGVLVIAVMLLRLSYAIGGNIIGSGG